MKGVLTKAGVGLPSEHWLSGYTFTEGFSSRQNTIDNIVFVHHGLLAHDILAYPTCMRRPGHGRIHATSKLMMLIEISGIRICHLGYDPESLYLELLMGYVHWGVLARV